MKENGDPVCKDFNNVQRVSGLCANTKFQNDACTYIDSIN